jgi:hypothetical protein
MANFTVGAVLALGADPRDPNLSRIHDTEVDNLGQLVQYQLTKKGVILPVPIKTAIPPTSLCSSMTESRTKRFSRHLPREEG